MVELYQTTTPTPSTTVEGYYLHLTFFTVMLNITVVAIVMLRIFTLTENKQFRRKLRHLSTPAEKKLWEILRNSKFHGIKFRRQHGIGRYIVDFYCRSRRLVIELDGETHFTLEAMSYDRVRTEYIENLGIRVVRFTNIEVLKNIEGVLSELVTLL